MADFAGVLRDFLGKMSRFRQIRAMAMKNPFAGD